MITSLAIFGANYLFVAIILIAGYYFLRQPREIQKRVAVFAAAVLPISYIVAKISSYFWYNPRPFVVNNIVPLISHAPDNGFPSDHTLLSAAIAATLFPFNKKLSAIAWILTVLVGASRVYADVHHVADIVGSIAITCFVSFIVFHVSKRFEVKKI